MDEHSPSAEGKEDFYHVFENEGAADATVAKTHVVGGAEIDLSGRNQLARGLKSRHIQFLALGGAIGTGLFVGSDAILSLVGPAPLFMAYLSMMFVV